MNEINVNIKETEGKKLKDEFMFKEILIIKNKKRYGSPIKLKEEGETKNV